MTNAPTGKQQLDRLVSEVASRMRAGASLAEVETALIGPAPLDGDRKEALWLYAWSSEPRRARRREAVERVMRLKASHANLG